MSVRDETPTSTCMDIMSQKDFHHLPVIDRNKPVAVVTAGDLFKFVVSEQSMALEELENSSSMSKGARVRLSDGYFAQEPRRGKELTGSPHNRREKKAKRPS